MKARYPNFYETRRKKFYGTDRKKKRVEKFVEKSVKPKRTLAEVLAEYRAITPESNTELGCGK